MEVESVPHPGYFAAGGRDPSAIRITEREGGPKLVRAGKFREKSLFLDNIHIYIYWQIMKWKEFERNGQSFNAVHHLIMLQEGFREAIRRFCIKGL